MTREKEILKKFKRGAVIETKEELKVLKKFGSIGMIHIGFDGHKKLPTASLTKLGRWLLARMK